MPILLNKIELLDESYNVGICNNLGLGGGPNVGDPGLIRNLC